MSKFSATVNSDLGNGSFWVEIRDAEQYSVPTTTSPHICPVDGVAHRNIGFRLFVHRFRLFGQKKPLKRQNASQEL